MVTVEGARGDFKPGWLSRGMRLASGLNLLELFLNRVDAREPHRYPLER